MWVTERENLHVVLAHESLNRTLRGTLCGLSPAETLAVRQQNSQVILIVGTEARFVDTTGGLTSEIKSWWEN